MSANICAVERCFRAILGFIVLSQVFVGLTTAFGWLGVLLLLSAIFGFCPAYKVLRMKDRG